MSSTRSTHRALLFAAYLMCAYVCAIPLVEAAFSASPTQAGVVAWRFGATGLFAQALMTPLLGLSVALGVSVYFHHRRTLQTLAVVSGFGAMATLVVVPLFTLDALELRGAIDGGARARFDITTLMTLSRLILAVLLGAALGFGGWGKSREYAHPDGRRIPLREAQGLGESDGRPAGVPLPVRAVLR
jgi:hypothetical protein